MWQNNNNTGQSGFNVETPPNGYASSLMPRYVLTELINFLNLGKHVLVVKGNSGTGKTTLVLSLLKEWGSNNLYVSTRTSPDELFAQFPWAQGTIPSHNILDATRPKSVKSQMFDSSEEFALPETLNVIYKLIETANVPTTVIIDSWNAITERVTLPKNLRGSEDWVRSKLEVLLVDSIKERGANLIVILEEEGKTKLDYLADGVVSLGKKDVDGRTVREIAVEKLRRVEIKQPRYLFTLSGGMFHYFEPFKEKHAKQPQRWQATYDESGYFSTGCRDFDGILGGGYKHGSYNVFEMDETISNWAFMTIIRPSILNFIAQGRGTVIVPIQGSSPGSVMRSLVPYIDERAFSSFVRIISTKADSKSDVTKTDELSKNIGDAFAHIGESENGKMQFTKSDISKPAIVYSGESVKDRMKLWDEIFSLLRRDTDKPVLDFTSFDTLEYSMGGNATIAVKEISEAIKKIRDEGNVGIGVLKPGLNIAQQVKNMADTYFRVVEIDGTYALYGKKPKTKIYNIEIDTSKGYPETKLTAIV